MLSIKLSRFGKRSMPTFRLVILDKSKDTLGDYIESVGSYNPRSKEINLNADRIKYWLSKGAQPSDTIHNLLVSNGLLEDKKRRSSRLTKKRREKIAEKEKATKKATATPEVKPEEPVTEVPAVETPVTE